MMEQLAAIIPLLKDTKEGAVAVIGAIFFIVLVAGFVMLWEIISSGNAIRRRKKQNTGCDQ